MFRKNEVSAQIKKQDYGSIKKCFLITGGTLEERKDKYRQLIRGDNYYMYADYQGENEIAVIFSAKDSDFKEMTFDKAKKLAGAAKLGWDFSTALSNGLHFGVINLSEKPRLRSRL